MTEDYYTEAKGKQKRIGLFIIVDKAFLENSWSQELVKYINFCSLFTNSRHNKSQANSVFLGFVGPCIFTHSNESTN
jgi:hypothetical protein